MLRHDGIVRCWCSINGLYTGPPSTPPPPSNKRSLHRPPPSTYTAVKQMPRPDSMLLGKNGRPTFQNTGSTNVDFFFSVVPDMLETARAGQGTKSSRAEKGCSSSWERQSNPRQDQHDHRRRPRFLSHTTRSSRTETEVRTPPSPGKGQPRLKGVSNG